MKTKRLLTLLLLVVGFTIGGWAELTPASDGWYELATVQDWQDFATLVQTMPTANARMTADIDLGDCQAMLGDSEHADNPTYSYQGTFDGEGHTLTVHYTGTSQTAPFAMLKAATIKNIHVGGTIRNTSGSQPAVIARVISGTTTVENVWSSVITTDTRTGWDEAAALVGCVDGYKSGHVVMHDCLFTGAVNSSGSYNGCFVGYINSGGSANVSNCLSLGTFNYTGDSYDIARGTYSNCYVKQWPSTIPASMQVTNDQIADGTIAYKLQNNRTELFWGQRIGIDERPVLTNDESYRVYRGKNGYTNSPDDPYTGLQQDADGYYLLDGKMAWLVFAALVNGGTYDAKAKMTADIDLGTSQTAICAETGIYYQGEFDGQGHTLTVHYDDSNDNFQGTFSKVQDAIIKNLHVTGTITTDNKYTGSIVGSLNIKYNCTIQNCRSSVECLYTGNGVAESGGIIGLVSSNATLTITDCLFDGSILTNTMNLNISKYLGGLVGQNQYGTVSMNNCLFAPKYISTDNYHDTDATLIGDKYMKNPPTNNSYYSTRLGTAQGTQATAAQLSDGTTTTNLNASRTGDAAPWVQDPLTNQPMLKLFAGKYKVPASGLGTFSAKAAFTLPEDLDAYYCKDYADGKISVAAINGVVPAETGVLLKGTAGETYTLTISNETPATVTDNALVAVTDQTTIQQTADGYTNFGLSGGVFKKVNSAGGTVKANRAYLHILTSALNGASAIGLVWDEETTGISATPIDNGQLTIDNYYDLQGRRVAHPTKCLYIVNGKKVVIK